MNKTIFLIIVLFSINTCLKAQASIDFYPKELEKELNRINGKNYILKELPNSPDVIRQIRLGKYYTLSSKTHVLSVKNVYIGRVNTCRAGGCLINSEQKNEQNSEFFDYFILFDSICTVKLVKIYNYQATHGHEVTAKSWLKQFIGYNGNAELFPGKNVDAISGATISVDATAFDIEHKTGLLKQSIKNSL